jgi:hypothetical protein
MKLHELLAVDTHLENQANKVRKELENTFEKKRHLFDETHVVFQSNEEGAQPVIESQSTIQTTVLTELSAIQPFLTKAIDSSYQVAEANTEARADVVLENGTVLLTGVPATSLLELEKRLAEVAALVGAIPTLDPMKGFKPDADRGQGIYKAREILKTRTKKTKKVLVKYPATEQHPAQTELIDEDVVVGNLKQQEWSGLVTPALKSAYHTKVEELIRAVRQARSRANEQEVDKAKKIGQRLLDYIFG